MARTLESMAWGFLTAWYFFIILVQLLGFFRLCLNYTSRPKAAASESLVYNDIPHITILRPVKGLDSHLYDCLAATFRQRYPAKRLTIYFCISTKTDPAYSTLERLMADFPGFDARIFIEDDDPSRSDNGGNATTLGPNPKVRNMSRGYREARGDILWIVDANVWIGKGVSGRMIDKLCGYRDGGNTATPYKFVHQLPVVVDVASTQHGEVGGGLLSKQYMFLTGSAERFVSSMSSNKSIMSGFGGGRLEEMFMTTAHAKFYTAINTVAISPCILGKSSMFRISHLNYLTKDSAYSPGIDFFSANIIEDHLIGDILWKNKVPEEEAGQKFKKHGLVFGDLVMQPVARMSLHEYWGRRVRWIRARKWTVLLATFLEPHTECFLVSAYGSVGLTHIAWFYESIGIPQGWRGSAPLYLVSVLTWMTIDYISFAVLHAGASIELDGDTPSFARPPRGGRRPLGEWLWAWFGRELLAFPIWAWAFLGGTTLMWRGKRFRVGMDTKVIEIGHKGSAERRDSTSENDWSRNKNRLG